MTFLNEKGQQVMAVLTFVIAAICDKKNKDQEIIKPNNKNIFKKIKTKWGIDMTEWFQKINEDYKEQRQIEEVKEKFYILGEGNHEITIDLSTKDKMIIDKQGQNPRTYILFKTIGCDKPYLRLTTYQYGLVLKKISSLPKFTTGDISKDIKIIALVTKEDDKLKFDISVISGDNDDYK